MLAQEDGDQSGDDVGDYPATTFVAAGAEPLVGPKGQGAAAPDGTKFTVAKIVGFRAGRSVAGSATMRKRVEYKVRADGQIARR